MTEDAENTGGVEQPEESIPFSVYEHIALNEDTNLEAMSDTTNGLLFVRMFQQSVRYSVDKKRWYLWNGHHWASI